ncbi:hypothetical protein DM01DRAFT_1305276 [Hesseltinella vesiculosa]|uniref:Uncharacterized protein n=1 Tax=Hesseltinella vesiculosa TaxID=101127 RepID=A0A1X2GIS6_9FUNG|nr:hypothetical protein DM01DRAFT_1305276 [Hesseltinella vesiculosa]
MERKRDIRRWQIASLAIDNNQYQKALESYSECCPSSKQHFNMGMIYAALGRHRQALEAYAKAIEIDTYFAVGYFQAGVCHFQLTNFAQARACFDSAYHCLRGNKMINYRQLGLQFVLYACEILYNRGVCLLYMDNEMEGVIDFFEAQRLKVHRQHITIDLAVQTRSQKLGIYSVPPAVVFRLTDTQRQLLEDTDLTTTFYKMYDKFMLASAGTAKNPAIPEGCSAYVALPTDNNASSAPRRQPANRPHHSQPSPISKKRRTSKTYLRSSSCVAADILPKPSFSSSSSSSISPTRNTSLKPAHTPLIQRPLPRTRSLPSLQKQPLPPAIQVGPFPSSSEKHELSSSASPNTPALIHSASSTSTLGSPLALALAPDPHPTATYHLADVPAAADHKLQAPDPAALSSSKVKVKLHHQDSRVLMLPANLSFCALLDKIYEKLDVPASATLALKYRNKEGAIVPLDPPTQTWCLARLLEDTIQRSNSPLGKVELWCNLVNQQQ